MPAIAVPRYIFTILAALFLIAALGRSLRQRRLDPAARTWLTIGLIFSSVSAWLWVTASKS